jgi:putative adhesin
VGGRLVLASIILLSVSRPVSAKNIDKDFHHVFPASRGTVLYLVHGDGEVTLTSWAKDSIAVHVHYRAEAKKVGWGKEPDFNMEFSQTGETVHAVGSVEGGGKTGFVTLSHEDYRVEIQAPTYVALDFEGQDGDVTIEGWRADVAVRLEDGIAAIRDVTSAQVRVTIQSGQATLDGIRADLFLKGEDGKVDLENLDVQKGNVRMQDGDVTMNGARGSFDIELEDGDLHMTRSRLENASIHSEDGDVDLDLDSSPKLDLDVFTRSGSVRVGLAPGSSVHYAAETKTGRVRIALPGASVERQSKDRASGDWNGGDGRLRVVTIDGPIDLRQSAR